ncbi:Crp/Fnr family transcriptional regulator [Paenibacillus tarimensis]|uniref:Crp/Fnr family transcriptional regulator n=1 Tax=Paenibacillus tarimensis TaxID=416012 RepID=UPI001F3B7F8A|nr:Crp/Fnr family transcriptional regulator [Paenibacillus tarimensis]MCF2944950.1 Crp/Fnr family transcriptional regulator [Paenibacillus tarimensis]
MPINKEQLCSAIPFFGAIDPDLLDKVLPYIRETVCKRGTIVFFEKDEADNMYFIRSGSVDIYTFDGTKKVILATLREGDYFGEMALIRPGLVRSATAEAAEPVKLYALGRSDFEHLIASDPRLVIHLLEDTMERLRRANRQIYELTFLNVRTRIIKRLARLAEEHGRSTEEGVLINMKLTHQHLADMVGAVRETVTKVLLDLQENGMIRVENKKILIFDLDTMMRLE